MDRLRGNLTNAIRPEFDANPLGRLLSKALRAKAPEHPVTGVAVMTQIGG